MREWVLKRYVYVYIVGRASLLRMETKGLRERVVAENGWCFGWVRCPFNFTRRLS